jgi:hypothetical protein
MKLLVMQFSPLYRQLILLGLDILLSTTILILRNCVCVCVGGGRIRVYLEPFQLLKIFVPV